MAKVNTFIQFEAIDKMRNTEQNTGGLSPD